MNQQHQPARPPFRPQRMKEQRPQDYAATPDQLAGATARRIIHDLGLADELATWRKLRDIIRGALREPSVPAEE